MMGRVTKCWIPVAVLLGGGAQALAAQASLVATRDVPVAVQPAAEPIEVDGVLSESAWAAAEVIPLAFGRIAGRSGTTPDTGSDGDIEFDSDIDTDTD